MSIQSEIDRITENVASTYSVLSEAGADTPETASSDNLASTAASIKAVLYGKEQSLTDEQQAQARTNIGAGTSSFSGSYADLSGTPTIPTKTSELTNDSGFLTQHQSLDGYAKTEDIPTALSELTDDASHRTVTDTEKAAWDGKSDFSGAYSDLTGKPTLFSGSYGDLTDVPSAFTPASHSQAASTITAGTFAGAVVANSSGQAPGTSLVRNTKLVAEETTPTVNGEIFWVYG